MGCKWSGGAAYNRTYRLGPTEACNLNLAKRTVAASVVADDTAVLESPAEERRLLYGEYAVMTLRSWARRRRAGVDGLPSIFSGGSRASRIASSTLPSVSRSS